MATLTIDKSGKTTGYNIQWYDGKKRCTIYLGGRRYNKKTAERVKEIVEALLYYRRNGITVPDKKTEHWLKTAPDELKAKLAKAELIESHEPKTCQTLWDAFMKFKTTEVKQSTVQKYQDCRTYFSEMFAPTEAIEKVTSERLLEWKVSLLDELAEATVAGHIKSLKAVFNWAVDQDWLTKSPMAKIPLGSFRNQENDRFITMDEYAKLLDACPNQEWRTIIALARIGGLRCPSELRRLRWTDVKDDRFLVYSPKTERHTKHREVPLFAKIQEELGRHDKSTEFVIQGFQGTTWRLHIPFQTIADKAGLGKIVCPFVNMRRSRSNEIDREFGSKLESLWIGHSEQMMKKHYHRATDEDYSKATG
jgi:integrase